MYIDCVFTYGHFKNAYSAEYTADKTVVVVDVLRLTSTITTALSHGTFCVFPAESAEAARELQKIHSTALLSGERNGQTLPGFDIGNSPLDFTGNASVPESIISCSTNGTKALLTAGNPAVLLCGSLLNANAVAEYALKTGNDIIVLCSGTNKQPSYDDIIGAGAIIFKLFDKDLSILMSDAAKIAYQSYAINKNDLLSGLLASYHGMHLSRIGRKEDVIFCAREDIYTCVPILENACITPNTDQYLSL